MESYEFSLTEAEKEVLDSYSQSINFTPGRIVEYIIKDLVVQWSDNAWRSGVAIAPETKAEIETTRAEIASLKEAGGN